MTDYQSQKIRNISFIAIIAVFFIHTLPQDSNRLSWVCFMQHLIHTVSNFAVPFFFIISGYLFFMSKDSIKNVSIGIKKRIRTLGIPYILWCLLFLLQIWIASFFKEPNREYFAALNEGDIIDFIYHTFFGPLPYAFHLWYVRDLLGLVALSPLIFLCQRKHPLVFLLIVIVICGLLKIIPWLSWPLTWFSIGSYFAFSKRDLLELRQKWIGVVMLIGYIGITAWFISNGMFTTADRWYAFPVILLGVIGIWNTYDIIGIHRHIPGYLTEQTFFLYCAHVPFLTIIATILFPIVKGHSVLEGFAYFFPALITCCVLVIIARWWQRLNRHSNLSSTIYKYLTGGR